MKYLGKNTIVILFCIILSSLINTIVVESQWEHDYSTSPGCIMQNISIVDTGTIWALGYSSFNMWDTAVTYIKLPGQYWETHFWNDLPQQTIYTSIAGIDSDSAIVGSEFGKVYKTTNRGYNWSEILNAGENTYVVNAIEFSRQQRNTGYVFCSRPYGPAGFKIYKTTDLGNTWQMFTPNFGNYYGITACVTDSIHVWYSLGCITSNCPSVRIAYTTNGGLSWLFSDREPGRRLSNAVTFKDDNLYGISFSHLNNTSEIMSYSHNGGLNWTGQFAFPVNFSPSSLVSVPASTVWYLGGVGLDSNNILNHIYKSTDEGLHWTDMTFESNSGLVTDLEAVKLSGKIYAWSSTGVKIFKLIDTAVVIGVNNSEINVPSEYFLHQNYPNPFNPITTISFDLPENSYVTLKIFDLTGREIANLADGSLTSGTHKIEFDGTGIASGIYFYVITAGEYIMRKKMVLLK